MALDTANLSDDDISLQAPADSNSDSDSLFGCPSELVPAESRPKPATPTSTEAASENQYDTVYGLQWANKDGHFLPMPRWTTEPTISAVVLTLQKVIDPHKQYDVEHVWDGTYNKIYSVAYDQTRLIMRVSLPVCPRTKIESEVATLCWICENTNLPVPKIRCHDSSRNNPIGFEWILMDRIDGTPLSQCWPSVTQSAKERIVKQIAGYAATAFRMQFKGVGNLYSPHSNSPASQPRVGEMVSPVLF